MKKRVFKSPHRLRLFGAVAIAALVSGAALATPEDDFKAAEKLYGDNDMVSATPLYTKAADQGYAPAQAALGEILNQAEYNVDSVKYFRMAAEQGNADGEFGLGSMYAEGKGIPRDLKVARAWIVKAAKQGHSMAINTLAEAYMNGGLGVTADDLRSPDAVAWLTKSAEQDYLPSMLGLAQVYGRGLLGAPIDLAKANFWAGKARELQIKNKNINPKEKRR